MIAVVLMRWFQCDTARADDPAMRARFGYLEGWVSIVVNLLVFAVKMIIGMAIGSISVIADAVHTCSDIATSAVVIWGFKISKKPADQDHPFGHGRMEDIATVIIAVMLCVVGLELMRQSAARFYVPVQVEANWVSIILLGVTIGIKEWLARFSFFLGKKINSSTLYADAWHHRSDAISTVFVIIAVAGALYNITILDAVFGVLVALYIVVTGIQLIRQTSIRLMGTAADEQLAAEIRRVALGVAGVEGVHDIVAHDYGTVKAISLHVEVSPALDVAAAHHIAEAVEVRLAQAIPASSSIVHIDLKRGTEVQPAAPMPRVKQVIKKFPDIVGFHGVELVSNERGDFLFLHVIVPKKMTVEQTHALEHAVRRALTRQHKKLQVSIHIEPCDGACPACPIRCRTYQESVSHE